MNFIIELDEMQGEEVSLELGNFEDLEILVDLLNGLSEAVQYRLEKVPEQKNVYLFIEDPVREDEYECGVIKKKGKKAFALSPAVHAMVMGAYQRYLDLEENL